MDKERNKNKFPPIVIALICIIIILIIGTIYISKNKYHIFNKEKDVSDKVGYTIPKKFEKTFTYDDMASYSYSENSYSCHFSISVSEFNIYQDGKSYLESNFDYTLSDKVDQIEEEKINGIIWYSIKKVQKNNTTVYRYATVKNEKVYDAEYSIYDYNYGDNADDGDNLCLTAKDEIIKSLKIKEIN